VNAPILAFFGLKGNAGKTFLAYHLSWMLSDLGERVLVCDFDPQADLTSACLDEPVLASLWQDDRHAGAIHRCIAPPAAERRVHEPELRPLAETLHLIPGDLALSSLEDDFAEAWQDVLGNARSITSSCPFGAFRNVLERSAASIDATVVLVDLGPNLGALNRAALLAADRILVHLGSDPASLGSLGTVGSEFARWRLAWSRRGKERPSPAGKLTLIGYTVRKHGWLSGRLHHLDDEWVRRMPEAYHRHMLGNKHGPFPPIPADDEHCIAVVQPYIGLMSLAREARKPAFHLTAADGAIRSHARAAVQCREDFRQLAKSIQRKLELPASGGLGLA